MKKTKIYSIIFILILLVLIFLLISKNMILKNEIKIQAYSKNAQEYYSVNTNNDITFENNIIINVDIPDYDYNNEYILKEYLNNELVDKFQIQKNKEISFTLDKEGNNSFRFDIYTNDNLIKSINKNIWYIKPYINQFGEKKSYNGINVHYISFIRKNYKVANDLIKKLGVNYLRTDFWYKDIAKNKDNYNYGLIDNWLTDLNNGSDIKILAIINYCDRSKSDKLINSDEEVNELLEFYNKIQNKYTNIKHYELINEANTNNKDFDGYITVENMDWYAKLYNRINDLNNSNKIYSSGTSTSIPMKNERISSIDFFENFIKYSHGKCMNYSFHPYDHDNLDELKKKISEHEEVLNEYGGFNYLSATEYGTTTYTVSEKQQAIDLVKQTSILNNECKNNYIYNLVSTGDENSFEQFGLLTKDYAPRLSYYSMKNYYQNTNGSEYIGTVSLANGLETHVYDKDGKAKIILWATDKNNPLTIDYIGFIASDIYGNAIDNTNGKLEITTSPIYLDNVSDSYFYQSIESLITTGYNEFNTKFTNEISKVTGLSNKLFTLNSFANTLSKVSSLDEETVNLKMEEHFELGKLILEAYKNGTLDVEYVKLSSMLDYLNKIGNSYEDLVTVSAKTRIKDLTYIINEVNDAKSLIDNNSNLEIIYPNKMYKFSQDFIDESSYIFGLEENDIKTGLINSKALHAKYLSEWSKEFSNIYITDSFKSKINPIIEANIETYNSNYMLYKNTNINVSYVDLLNSLNNLTENQKNITKDKIIYIYDKQYTLVNTIIDEYNSGRINISKDYLKTLITNLLNISNQYKDLFSMIIAEDDISADSIKDELNKLITRYNDNSDIDISMSTDFINNVKNIYENSINEVDIVNNYINKRRILNSCISISKILENDIKANANNESKFISLDYNKDINVPTNEDIVVTINLPNNKSYVINNDSNKITFDENGKKEIKINIRGYEYILSLEINNIYKSLIDIQNDNIIDKGAIPKIEDKSRTVKLFNLETNVSSYSAGKTIDNCGFYTLFLEDYNGNKNIIKFVVTDTYNDDKNNSKKYVRVCTDNIKVSEIKKYINADIKRGNNLLLNDDIVSTGDKIVTSNNEITLIVRGDISKKGKSSIIDIIKIRKIILGQNNINAEQKLASDLNEDGKISIIDLLRIRKILIGAE